MDAITASQCRAARATLRWTLKKLAGEAGISYLTVINLERGKNVQRSTQLLVQRAFEDAGIVFEGESGVRLQGIPAKERVSQQITHV